MKKFETQILLEVPQKSSTLQRILRNFRFVDFKKPNRPSLNPLFGPYPIPRELSAYKSQTLESCASERNASSIKF